MIIPEINLRVENANDLFVAFILDNHYKMNMNANAQLSFKEPYTKIETHCQYFEQLQNKLLEQSEKLTCFMGKSLINDSSKKKLKLAISPPKDNLSETFKTLNKISLKNGSTKPPLPYMKKMKEICQKLKNPHHHVEEILKTSKQYIKKEKEHHEHKHPPNLTHLHQQIPQEKIAQSLTNYDKNQKPKKMFKFIAETQSLKDTISTESCKSLKITTEQIIPSLHEHKIQLQDFDIIRFIAQGKLGHVYLVRHKKTHFICALKRIHRSVFSSDAKNLIQRFRQIKIQSFLDHPNIIQLYSVFCDENNLYLLMELCFSGSVYENLKLEGRFPEEKIRSVLKQVCHAVQYMHDNDILHRDLKPQNILFHESIAKICDFGWSVNSPLLRETLCGTPLYSSPEIVQKQQYDNKIDIWNIGILTYQLLYGKVPFQIRNEQDFYKITDDQIYFPRSKPASPQIKDFIIRCLSKNPKERFSIIKLMDHQFLNPRNQLSKSA